MDALRRLIQSATGQGGDRQVWRVPPSERAPRAPRLGGADRALSDALTQLGEGVPLNWGQIEDDPELLTLARLQGAAQESRLQSVPEPPPAERARIVEQLAAQLPKPTPPKAQKVAPKSLAGFSERVQVLTQVEEDVPLHASVPKTLVRVVLALAAVALVVFGISWVISTFTTPAFTWIEVRKGSDLLNRITRPGGWQQYPCKVERQSSPLASEGFHTYTSAKIIRDRLTFDIPLLPLQVSNPSTYTLEFSQASVAPCKLDDEVSNDPGAMLKLNYNVHYTIIDPTAPLTALGSPTGEKEVIVPLVAYVAREQPIPINVREGTWREVHLTSAKGGPDLHGVIWQGDYFHDRSGEAWYGPVIVLLVERGDMIMELEGAPHDGITEDFLLNVAQNVAW